eukprot:122343_1
MKAVLCCIFVLIHIFNAQTSSEWMKSVQHYELINVNTNQLQSKNIIELDIVNQHFTINIENNHHLINDHLTITHRQNNTVTSKHHSKHIIEECHYYGKVSEFPQSTVSLSICSGRGIRGKILIPELNDSFIIAPSNYHLNREYDTKHSHDINDQHMIYRHSDIDDDVLINHSNKQDAIEIIQLQENQSHRSLITTSDLTVEVIVVLDVARVNYFKGLYTTDRWEGEAQASTMDIINHVSNMYYNTNWGNNIGTIQIILKSIQYWHDWTGSIAIYQPSGESGQY